jgi:hypothetical protein
MIQIISSEERDFEYQQGCEIDPYYKLEQKGIMCNLRAKVMLIIWSALE